MITCDMDHGPVNLALTFQLPTEVKRYFTRSKLFFVLTSIAGKPRIALDKKLVQFKYLRYNLSVSETLTCIHYERKRERGVGSKPQ